MTKFKEGEKVWTYGFGGGKHTGTIHKNTEFPHVSEWYISFEDGDFAVLDLNQVYKFESQES